MNEHKKEFLDTELDFFKYMDEIVKWEAKRQKLQEALKKAEVTPNKEYYLRYGRSPYDRFWIGPQRYR